MRKLFKLFATNKSDRDIFFVAFILLNLVRLGLFLLPFPKLLQLVETVGNFISGKSNNEVEISQILHAVHTSSYYALGKSKCLAKALTVQTLLKASGYSSELKIGVAKEGLTLQAHAWVEQGGRVIIGSLPNLDTYSSLTSI